MSFSYLYKNYLTGSLVLIFFSFLAHFFIFERYSVAPDDYQFFLMKGEGLGFFLLHPDRPLQYVWAQIQNFLVGYNSFRGLILIFLTSSLTLISSFLLIRVLIKDNLVSFIVALIYLLLTYKLEIFHYPINSHVNIASSLYIFSLFFFIKYFEQCSYKYLLTSFSFYLLGLFWYEVGFFLPLIMFVYVFLFKNELIFKKELMLFGYSLLFLALFYSVYRITGAFGFSPAMAGRSISFNTIPQGIQDVFHIFLGRSSIRSMIYGFYLFFRMDSLIIFLTLFANLVTVGVLYSVLKDIQYSVIDKKIIIFSLILIFFTVIPNILVGSIGGRNTIISSVGVSFLVFYMLLFFKKFSRFLITSFIFFSLIIGQGNAWAQVVSSKINGSVFNFLLENQEKISRSEYVLFDTKSFADNINHSFLSREYNVLNTYYGAQAFEDWGLQSMVYISQLNKDKKPTVFVSTSDIINEKGLLKFYISNLSGYRDIEKKGIQISENNTFTVDYDLVFKEKLESKFKDIL